MESYFNQCLHNSGFIIHENQFFSQDLYLSIKQLEKLLQIRENKTAEFVNALEKYMLSFKGNTTDSGRKVENVISSVRIISNNADGDILAASHQCQRNGGNYYYTNSFLKLLLRIQIIQDKLIEALMRVIIQLMTSDYTNSSIDKKESLRSTSMIIFNHVRWCEKIYNPSLLMPLLFEEVIPLLSSDKSIKIEIIGSLPSLILDQDHEQLVVRLVDLINSESGLVPCVFDTISNLNLQKNSAAKNAAIQAANDLLDSATETELPIIVRFLLDTATDLESAKNSITELRLKLVEFLSTANPEKSKISAYDIFQSQKLSGHERRTYSSDTETMHKKRSEFQSCVALIINAMKSAFSSNPVLITAFIKLMDECQDYVNEIDLWIIYCLFGTNKNRFKMMGVLIKKYQNGSLLFSGISSSLNFYAELLDDVFANILALAQSIISLSAMQCRLLAHSRNDASSGPESSAHFRNQNISLTQSFTSATTQGADIAQNLASELYLAIYTEFSSIMKRQEIIASLVSHVFSNQESESTSALRILNLISESEFFVMTKVLKGCDPEHQLSNALCPLRLSLVHRLEQQFNSDTLSKANLKSFLPFLYGLLYDASGKMTLIQVRSVFRLLFQTSIEWEKLFNTESLTSDISMIVSDEVMNVLRKFSDSSNVKLKNTSVLGYLSLLVVLTDFERLLGVSNLVNQPIKNNTGFLPRAENLRIVKYKVLQDIFGKFMKDEDVENFVLNELSVIVDNNNIPQDLQEKLLNYSDEEIQKSIGFDLHLFHPFQKLWSDFIQKNKANNNIITSDRCSLCCGLLIASKPSLTQRGEVTKANMVDTSNLEGSEIIHVKILSTMMSSIVSKRTGAIGSSSSDITSFEYAKDSIQLCNTRASLLKLAASCHRSLFKNVDGVSSLLHASLELPSFALVNVIENLNAVSQTIICKCYWQAIDWMREVLNTFSFFAIPSTSEDDSLSVEKGRLLHRMNSLVDMEVELVMLLQRCPKIFEDIFLSSSGSKGIPKKTEKKINKSVSRNSKRVDEEVDSDVDKCEDDGELIDVNCNRLSPEYIESILESLLRPLHGRVSILLGFEKKRYPLFYDDEMSFNVNRDTSLIAPPCSQRHSKPDNEMSPTTVCLHDKSVIRLLQLILSCCKAYHQSIQSVCKIQDASSIITLNSILPSSTMSRIKNSESRSISIDNFLTSNHVGLSDLPELDYYLFIEERCVFKKLFTILNTFLASFCNSSEQSISIAKASLLNISSIQRTKDEIFELKSPTLNNAPYSAESPFSPRVRPEDMLSKVILVFGIIESALDSKTLTASMCKYVDEYIQRTFRPDSMVIPNLNTLVPIIFDCVASLGGTDYRCNDAITEKRSTDAFGYFSLGVYALFNLLNRILGQIKQAELFDLAISTLRIMDKLLSLFKSLINRLENVSENQNENILRTLSYMAQSYREFVEEFRLSSDKLLIEDWNEKASNQDAKSSSIRYTNRDLGYILTAQFKYFESAREKLSRVGMFTKYIFPSLFKDQAEENSDSSNELTNNYKTLTLDSFQIYYGVLLNELCEAWKALDLEGRNLLVKGPLSPEYFKCTKAAIEAFKVLITLTREDELLKKKQVIFAAMKYGRIFVSEFLNSTDVLTDLSKQYPDQVVDMIGVFQKGTRQLQALCAHGITNRDKALSKEVPLLKKLLETVIFKMKFMMTESNNRAAIESFVVKALAPKNVDGSKRDLGQSNPSPIKKSKANQQISSAEQLDERISKPQVGKKRKAKQQVNIDDQDKENQSEEESVNFRVSAKKRSSTIIDDDEDDLNAQFDDEMEEFYTKKKNKKAFIQNNICSDETSDLESVVHQDESDDEEEQGDVDWVKGYGKLDDGYDDEDVY